MIGSYIVWLLVSSCCHYPMAPSEFLLSLSRTSSLMFRACTICGEVETNSLGCTSLYVIYCRRISKCGYSYTGWWWDDTVSQMLVGNGLDNCVKWSSLPVRQQFRSGGWLDSWVLAVANQWWHWCQLAAEDERFWSSGGRSSQSCWTMAEEAFGSRSFVSLWRLVDEGPAAAWRTDVCLPSEQASDGGCRSSKRRGLQQLVVSARSFHLQCSW